MSAYYLTEEIAGVYRGMLIAIPASHWERFGSLPVAEFAAVLRELSAKVDMARLQKSRSRPKKAKPKRRHSKKRPHVSTFRILQARKAANR